MRDKIVFFILGALLATLAYLVGNMNNAKARDNLLEVERLKVGILKVDHLNVKDNMYVGGNGGSFVRISALNGNPSIQLVGKGVNPPSVNMNVWEEYASVWITKGGEDAPEASMSVGGDELVGGSADIHLRGGGEDAPILSLRVGDYIGVAVEGRSHVKRPEASFDIFTVKKRDGKFRSGMRIEDSLGTNSVDPFR